MPINFTDKIEQANRTNNVSTDAFFHLMASVDVDFTVEKILLPTDGPGQVTQAEGKKYVVIAPFNALTVPGSADGDIVIYQDGNWSVYVDVSNPETAYPIIYDKRTEKFYHRTSTEWVPIINSKSSLDGGTF
jgi:hypothetical protein